jgi:hypothetical protein
MIFHPANNSFRTHLSHFVKIILRNSYHQQKSNDLHLLFYLRCNFLHIWHHLAMILPLHRAIYH